MPVGTGTLFVKHAKNPNVLIRESKSKNVTETQESQVIQYIAHGGFQKYSNRLMSSPSRIISAIHAGPGQLTFGHSQQQRADVTLVFKAIDDKPAIIFVHNYHGQGPYGHYEGHLLECRLNNGTDCTRKIESDKMDAFRLRLAIAWSAVNPLHLLFEYSTSYACEFFCGNKLDSLRMPGKQYLSLHELLHIDFPQPNDEIFIAQSVSATRKILNIKQLENDIFTGKETGFVTLKGGREQESSNACDQCGFCVQKINPTSHMMSEFTINQIKQHFNYTTMAEVDSFLAKLPARTLNTCTFIEEETMSTTYLQWLMKERGFSHFSITHFIAYKFSNYTREFLAPLLQQRHDFKKSGNVTAAAAVKLSMNSNYG